MPRIPAVLCPICASHVGAVGSRRYSGSVRKSTTSETSSSETNAPCTRGRFLVALGIKQHIAFSEQLFRAVHIDDRPGIHAGRNRKCDSRRHVCLDQSGDDVDGRTLGGNDQMDTCCTRQLRQTADGILDFTRGNHHEVSQLVDDDHDLRQFFRLIL